MCRAPVDTGSFDVPSEILKLLPPSEVISLLEEEGAGRKQQFQPAFFWWVLGRSIRSPQAGLTKAASRKLTSTCGPFNTSSKETHRGV